MKLHSGGYLTFYMPGQKKSIEVCLSTSKPLIELLQELQIPLAEVELVAINGVLADINAAITDADEVNIFSSINGG